MSSLDPVRWSLTVLCADDDEDDRVLISEVLEQSRVAMRLRFVADGQELIDYLRGERGFSTNGSAAPRPSIILLDLNMPRKTGHEALAEIKADPALRQIPVVVLTTSADQVDIDRSYDLGASSYIAKPFSHADLGAALDKAMTYWNTVELPEAGRP